LHDRHDERDVRAADEWSHRGLTMRQTVGRLWKGRAGDILLGLAAWAVFAGVPRWIAVALGCVGLAAIAARQAPKRRRPRPGLDAFGNPIALEARAPRPS
jgi:hypothetical protein